MRMLRAFHIEHPGLPTLGERGGGEFERFLGARFFHSEAASYESGRSPSRAYRSITYSKRSPSVSVCKIGSKGAFNDNPPSPRSWPFTWTGANSGRKPQLAIR